MTLAVCIVPWEGTGSDEEVGEGIKKRMARKRTVRGKKRG